MALFKDANFLQASNLNAFDEEWPPGNLAPYSGIYRCRACGKEVISTHGHPLPPQNHHQHTISQGNIVWHLIVGAAAN